MEIVAVDRRLLQPAAVDEDETEAVVISCVEFLLSETNAYYQQKCLAHEAISSVSTRIRDNVLDTVFAAVLDAEVTMDEHGFRPESRPEAATQDRHAVRSVPSKSPEKPASTRNNFQNKPASSPPSRAGSLPDNLRSRAGTKKRGQITKVETDKPSAITPSIQTFEREFEMDCEKPEIKEWREKCLKMLAASKKKPGFSKLAAIARAFAVPENRVSMEVGVIAAPPENIVEALAETPVNMKTNVDSFASILDLTTEVENSSRVIENVNISIAMRRTTRKPGAALDSTSRNLRPKSTTIHSIAENSRRQSKRRSQSSNVSDTSLQQPRKSTILTDSLSRRKQTRKLSLSESLSGNSDNGWNSSRSLWNYEQESGSATTRTFVAEDSDFNTNSFPETMHVACGVVLLQGEFVVEGPGWGENSTTMSRRRFGLQQQLATDALLCASLERDLYSPHCSSLDSSVQFGYPVSPLSEFHLRDYEEVPPEPIPIPQLSPISTSALTIPRTHLASSLSTPSLRVRSPVKTGISLSSGFGENTGSTRSIATNSSGTSTILGNSKPRPTTALRAITIPPNSETGRARAASATSGKTRSSIQSVKNTGSASAKYLREFPKPKSGVIRMLNEQAAGLLGHSEDRQRTAWMS